MPRVDGGTIACSKCPEKFARPNGLSRHMRETHGIPSNKREAAKSAAQTGKKRGRPRKGQAIAPGVAAAVAELGAKGTALRLLRQLKEIRSKLDQRIGAVEELVEVL